MQDFPLSTYSLTDCNYQLHAGEKQLEVQGGRQLNASRPIAGDAHGFNATVLAFNPGRAAWSINCLSICKHLLFFFTNQNESDI
jgi:hypothetical protein